MTVNVYTPEYTRSFEAAAVFLPGSAAPFEVLPGHAPIISTLEAGTVRWRLTEGSTIARGSSKIRISGHLQLSTFADISLFFLP